MTMLDRMRRHKSWLKWSLAIVVATFILLYVPQFLGAGSTGTASTDVIATVNGQPITAGTYQQLYLQQVSQIRSQYGEITDQVLRQLGVGQRLVQSLVAQEAILAEAERLGITVSDGELRERLIRLPMFQRNGQFVGEADYRMMLANGRPPITTREFERDFRRALISEKLQKAVTGWIRVSDADVEQEYRRRNEKVKLDVAVFTADKFKSSVQPTDADMAKEFEANKERYRVPEKRRVRYLALDGEAFRSKMAVTPAEVEARYKESIQTYSTPEQIRASHILLKTEGKDEAAVRKIAESVLAKVKGGGNFAALAKQYSEDDVSKVKGGDLDFFGKGAMAKEFEDAAWALDVNQTSDLVKSQFGFHIIRVTAKKAATTKTLAEVRNQIEDGIKFEKARAEATRIAGEIAGEIKAPADLDKVAAARGLKVGDSGLFSRDEPLSGLGFAPAVSSEAFTLETGKVSGSLQTGQGFAFIALAEVKPTYIPTLEEAKPKVREDVARTKALEAAQKSAAALAQAKSSFTASAKASGATVNTTDAITRGAAIPGVGVSEKVDNVAFALKPGEVSAPISTETAIVVVRVIEHQNIVPTGLDAERDSIRADLTQQQGSAFFNAYMTKARTKMNIEYRDDAIRALTGA